MGAIVNLFLNQYLEEAKINDFRRKKLRPLLKVEKRGGFWRRKSIHQVVSDGRNRVIQKEKKLKNDSNGSENNNNNNNNDGENNNEQVEKEVEVRIDDGPDLYDLTIVME